VDFAFCLIPFLIVAAVTALLIWAIQRSIRFQKVIAARMAAVHAQENPILVLPYWNQHCQTETINGLSSKWENSVLAVTATGIILFDRSWTVDESFRLSADNLRWFGRPQKYTNGENEIWLHLEQDGKWTILKIRLWRDSMQTFVRALKTVVDPQLVTAYRRQRPYIHAGPVKGQPATQDIHGAWSLEDPVTLYLMPRFLVILRSQIVLRKLPLESIQQIGALRRLDQPEAQGLVRFRAEEETFAFAVDNHEQFAGQLADAAKRTLEAPMERKQKGKDEDEEDYDADWDGEDWEALEEPPKRFLGR
jgi:hypothetical protein